MKLSTRFGILIALFSIILTVGASAQKTHIETGYISTDDGTRLFFQKVGNGKQVVIIPGGLFTFEDFQTLAGADRTLIFYDMRGRGRSDAIPDDRRASLLGIHQDVADLERVRRHFDATRVSLIGYSYLGLMTVMYAMDHPAFVERVVQIGPVPLKFDTVYPKEYTNTDRLAEMGANAEDVAKLEKMRTDGAAASDPKGFCEASWRVDRYRLVGNPANIAKLGQGDCHMPNEYPVNLAKHFMHSFASVQRLDIPLERVSAVKMPVLTVHGTKDRNAVYGSGREWARNLPNARLYTVTGGAHQVWVDEPKVLTAIDQFLKGSWPEMAERIR